MPSCDLKPIPLHSFIAFEAQILHFSRRARRARIYIGLLPFSRDPNLLAKMREIRIGIWPRDLVGG